MHNKTILLLIEAIMYDVVVTSLLSPTTPNDMLDMDLNYLHGLHVATYNFIFFLSRFSSTSLFLISPLSLNLSF